MKWSLKTSLTAIVWVFILSITWNGRTMFSYANQILVQNPLVETIDEELATIWDKLSETAKITFSEQEGEDEKV